MTCRTEVTPRGSLIPQYTTYFSTFAEAKKVAEQIMADDADTYCKIGSKGSTKVEWFIIICEKNGTPLGPI